MHLLSFFNYFIKVLCGQLGQLAIHYYLNYMTSNTIPHPPNSAWLPPIDPNDEETLEQEELMIQQQFKNILTQDGTNALGAFETREEDEEDEEDDEGDDMEEYADEIQIPGDEEI